MNEADTPADESTPAVPAWSAPARLNLPGFITDEQIGLGDLVTRVTRSLGVPTCGGCVKRAQALNGWVSFGPRH